MSRVLVTGGAGFIGVHLARRLLATGYSVDLVDDFSRGVADAGLEDLRSGGDVRLLELDAAAPGSLDQLARDYTEVVHLAAIVGVGHVTQRPYAVLRDNVSMLENVIGWARRLPRLQRLLFASTSEVYAGTLEHFGLPVPTPETVPLALPDLGTARTSYMMSKLYGEALCRHSGLPFTIVRPHNVYGPRMGLSHVIPELLERAHNATDGSPIAVWSVEHRRTFCFVEDAVEQISRALQAPACVGETLNVGAQSPEIPIGELAQVIMRTVGRKLAVDPQPPTPGSPLRRCPDMSKTTRLTGHGPAVPLEEGVRRTYAWYREHVFEAASGPVAR